VSHERAAVELREARSLVQALVAEDADFAGVVGRSPIEYVLVDDYDAGDCPSVVG
jgi:hypothetical protein